MNIQEDYVSFETAKLLKEKGFNESCHATYDTAVTGEKAEFSEYGVLSYFPYGMKNSDDKYNMVISAPTLQMAIKWLVREYRLYVNVVPSVEGYYWTEKWHSYVEDLNKRYPFGRFVGTFNSPEEACESAIKCCFENLI